MITGQGFIPSKFDQRWNAVHGVDTYLGLHPMVDGR